jgi:hypothetical protein
MLPADCDMVLVATGALGDTKDLNPSQIGVEGEQGHFILTTPELRIRGSKFSNIYVMRTRTDSYFMTAPPTRRLESLLRISRETLRRVVNRV